MDRVFIHSRMTIEHMHVQCTVLFLVHHVIISVHSIYFELYFIMRIVFESYNSV